MYSIKINKEQIDLPPNSVVNLNLINPHLLYDSVEGKRGNIPKIGWTLNNQKAFNYIEMPQLQSNDITRYECGHEYNGRILHEGVFVLTRASRSDGYSGTYVENIGEFFGDWQAKLLTECPFDFDNIPHLGNDMVWYDGDVPAYCYPTIINADYYGTAQGIYSGRMNDMSENVVAGVTSSPKVPMFFASYILTRIEKLTGKHITGSAAENIAFQNLLLYNTREQVGAFPSIQNHLPELSLSSHLMELYRKLFNQGLEFNTDTKTLDFIFFDSVFEPSDDVLDWTEKLTNTETKVFELSPRLRLSMTLDSGDALMKDKPPLLQDYFSNADESKGILPIQSKYSTLLVDSATGLVITKQQGITETNAQLTNKCSPKVLFWNGMVNGTPTATPHFQNYSLYFGGENGIVNRLWKNTITNRLQRFYLEKGVILNESDIALVDFKQKIYINGTLFFLVNANVSLPIEKETVVLLVSC
jgi:hypothetical protein